MAATDARPPKEPLLSIIAHPSWPSGRGAERRLKIGEIAGRTPRNVIRMSQLWVALGGLFDGFGRRLKDIFSSVVGNWKPKTSKMFLQWRLGYVKIAGIAATIPASLREACAKIGLGSVSHPWTHYNVSSGHCKNLSHPPAPAQLQRALPCLSAPRWANSNALKVPWHCPSGGPWLPVEYFRGRCTGVTNGFFGSNWIFDQPVAGRAIARSFRGGVR